MSISDIPRTIWWEDGTVRMVDQSRLPLVGDLLVCNTYEGVCHAIRGMAVRGAPALGVAAALGIALWAVTEGAEIESRDDFLDALDAVAAQITETRPTAVNLFWGAERMKRFARENADVSVDELRELILAEALNVMAEDEERNRTLGAHGAALLAEGSRVLTHCNAGSLATAYFGTALGVIFSAHEQGRVSGVWVDETRPVLQGARLTAWELERDGIPVKVACDNACALLMSRGMVQKVVVGADRIAANGDAVNKIGTFGVAILAKHFGVPFYVAAPVYTIDPETPRGVDVPIEDRDPREVTHVGETCIVPEGVEVYNLAFDPTPAELIAGIVTERGVLRPPYGDAIAKLFA